MAFTDPFIRRPVLATVVSLLIVLLGFQAWSKLPLRQYPQMENALITVTTAYPGGPHPFLFFSHLRLFSWAGVVGS